MYSIGDGGGEGGERGGREGGGREGERMKIYYEIETDLYKNFEKLSLVIEHLIH